MFAYNWSMFSREMKAFIAFLPLLGVQGLLFLKIRAQASDVWIQSLTLALGIAFLSALGLIYQAYQISYSLQSMLLTGFVLMLPAVYLLDGYYLALLYKMCQERQDLPSAVPMLFYLDAVSGNPVCALWRLLRLYPCASD